MLVALFNNYLVVDWSANSSPKQGKDSIWLAFHDGERLCWLENPKTRLAALDLIRDLFLETVAQGRKLFAGFDFAFGWPCGCIEHLGVAASWSALWAFWAEHVRDDQSNANNS